MNLITLLSNSITNYDDNDIAWRQFVSDHKAYLIANSVSRNITTAYLQTYNYNLQAYLRSINYNTSCTWIVALINNFANDVSFTTGVNFLYVPQFAIVQQLYTSYMTSTQNAA